MIEFENVIGYVTYRIKLLEKLVFEDLDRNDYLSAIRNRGAQLELEALKNEFLNVIDNDKIDSKENSNILYTSSEAASIIGIDQTNISRNAVSYGGQKIKGKWLFPKEIIDQNANRYVEGKKPGRKRKM